MGGCTMEMFESDLQTDLIQDIQKTCKADDTCVTSCSAAIQTLTEHPCFNVRIYMYFINSLHKKTRIFVLKFLFYGLFYILSIVFKTHNSQVSVL